MGKEQVGFAVVSIAASRCVAGVLMPDRGRSPALARHLPATPCRGSAGIRANPLCSFAHSLSTS